MCFFSPISLPLATIRCHRVALAVATMGIVLEELGMALNGEDTDGDGTIVQEQEGTIECGIEYISRLVGFPVTLAK